MTLSGSCCRSCGAPLRVTFVDLGMSPLANSLLTPEQGRAMEPFYPLHAFVCSTCFLVQLEEFESPTHIFSDYLYFSSYATSWLDHARRYADAMVERLGLTQASQVVEVASNDGYLLQFFKQHGVGVLGIEPAANVARHAIEEKGVPTEVAFFGQATAERLAREQRADLIVANNVLAHVPDINDFVAGFKSLLKPGGTITVEFPHLMRQIELLQFDTIYHEHFSYLSLLAIEPVFERAGLVLYDVEELPTHGGSLRIFASHAGERTSSAALLAARAVERAAGLDRLETYQTFSERVVGSKCGLLTFLIEARRAGKSVVGYGAAAKGNTMLNYCGVGPELVQYVVDRSPHKQGRLLPGTHIPVRAPEAVAETKPDYLLVLAWNLVAEIQEQMSEIRSWGGRFVVAIPDVRID